MEKEKKGRREKGKKRKGGGKEVRLERKLREVLMVVSHT